MKEVQYDGNIFLLPNPSTSKKDACLVTTNGIIRRDGKAVMGAGIAKYCRDTFSGVDEMLAQQIKRFGNIPCWLGSWIIPGTEMTHSGTFDLFSFPTKNDWKDNSDIKLIRQSCKKIVELVESHNIDTVYMSCPGCSNGHLDYWKDVRPILLEELNLKFTVCIPSHIYKKGNLYHEL